jgi:hypothetical protein
LSVGHRPVGHEKNDLRGQRREDIAVWSPRSEPQVVSYLDAPSVAASSPLSQVGTKVVDSGFIQLAASAEANSVSGLERCIPRACRLAQLVE